MTQAELNKNISEATDSSLSDITRNNAMNKVIHQFLPYINKTVFALCPESIEEGKSAAIEGLYHAMRKYNPASGNNFFTYAYNCISGYIRMAQRDGRLVRIPNKELDRLRRPENRDDYIKMTNYISLDHPVSKDDDKTVLGDMICVYDKYGFFESDIPEDNEIENETLKRVLRFAIQITNTVTSNDPRHSHHHNDEIYCMYKGILDSPTYSPREICKILKDRYDVYLSPQTVVVRCAKIDEYLIIKLPTLIEKLSKYKVEPNLLAEYESKYLMPREAEPLLGELFDFENNNESPEVSVVRDAC